MIAIAAMPRRSKLSTSATAAASVGTGLTPSSPVFLRTSGSLVGQMTVDFLKPDYLGDGAAISGGAVTATNVYVFSTEGAARYGTVGTPVYSGNAGTNSTVTITSITAGTYWVHASCVNGGGTSYPSQPISVTVT